MADSTTVEVDRETADMLENIGPNKKQAVRRAVQESRFGGRKQTRTVQFNVTLDPAQGAAFRKDAPITGILTQIIPDFKSGADDLVDLSLSVRGTTILPSQGSEFLTLDDATPVYTVSEEVSKGETIKARVINRDASFSHKISVTAVVQGVGR